MLSNLLGFNEHNKRLEERRLEQQARFYDFPRRQQRQRIKLQPDRRYGERTEHHRRLPLLEPPKHVIRDMGDGQLRLVRFTAPDGLPINLYRRRQPEHHHHGRHLGHIQHHPTEDDYDSPGGSSCDDIDLQDGNIWGSDDSLGGSFVDSFEDLTLGRRQSYERFRPIEFYDQTHRAPHRRFVHPRSSQDHEHPHENHHDRPHHQHCQDHHHRQSHIPHEGHRRHHPSHELEAREGRYGSHRSPGMWDRDAHRIGQRMPSEAFSDIGSDETW